MTNDRQEGEGYKTDSINNIHALTDSGLQKADGSLLKGNQLTRLQASSNAEATCKSSKRQRECLMQQAINRQGSERLQRRCEWWRTLVFPQTHPGSNERRRQSRHKKMEVPFS